MSISILLFFQIYGVYLPHNKKIHNNFLLQINNFSYFSYFLESSTIIPLVNEVETNRALGMIEGCIHQVDVSIAMEI